MDLLFLCYSFLFGELLLSRFFFLLLHGQVSFSLPLELLEQVFLMTAIATGTLLGGVVSRTIGPLSLAGHVVH